MGDILTLEQYKIARKITDSSSDDQLELAIAAATDAVLAYTDRDFTSDPTSSTRTYPYTGSGIVDIDDCEAVTSVKINGSTLTEDQDYITGPTNADVVYWLDFGHLPPATFVGSVEMGFTRNLDTIGRRQRFNFIEVTATFGWPADSIPASVRQAAIWLVDEFAATDAETEGVQAEAISDLSYVYSSPENRSDPGILPPRVRELLDPFRRLSV